MPMIACQGVEYQYGGAVPVTALRPTDLIVERGEYLAVTGPSGSGKTTLLSILGLMARPTNGVYRLNGEDVSNLDDAAAAAIRSRLIGFVFQSFHLLDQRSVLENTELGMAYGDVPRHEHRERARSALRQVGLGHRLEHRPTELSGGERQRVALARALSKSPTVIFADEPTGNLDSKTSGAILDLFDEMNGQGVAIVCVTHDEAVAARAGRRIAMLDGVLVSDSSSPAGVR